jgi:DNA (cytosine-5)-methyltransferase 1
MRNPIMLCGSMFNLRIERGYLQRHRLFESNIMLQMPRPCNHEGQAIGVYGNGRGGGPLRLRTANAAEAKALMGIDWAGRNGITQAVPPAYTEYLGGQLIKRVSSQRLFT